MLRFFARFAGDDTNIRSIDRFKEDVKNANATTNRFPSVVFLDPQFHTSSQSGGELEENDDHPPADLFRGQTLIHDVYSALIANPALWSKTLFIVTYDEHGGFFDHLVPPVAESLRKGNLPQINVNYGVRVPTLLASPWIPKGSLVKDVLDHASILKSILVRFCASAQPFLSDRVLWANDLGAALTLSAPRPVVQPAKPAPRNKAMAATAGGRPVSERLNVPMRELTGPNADFHVLMQVVGHAIRGKP
jgi:phospholipase C